MKETQRHRQLFEEWYAHGRSVPKCAETCRVPERTLRKYAVVFDWHQRADCRDWEAAQLAERQAVQRQAALIEEQRQAGELSRRRGVPYLLHHEITSARDAIQALKVGIELERQALSLPAWVFEVLAMSEEELRAEQIKLARLAAQHDWTEAAPLDQDGAEAD